MENKSLSIATTPKLVDISRLVGGAPQIELYLLQAVMIMSMLMRNLLVPILFNGRQFVGSKKLYWSKFCIDYIFVVVPAILAMTVLGEYLDLFALVLFLVDVLLLLFLVIEYLLSGQPFPLRAVLSTKVDESFLPTAFLTIFRGSMLVQIGVAILAVDFNVFPSKFAKTIHYGHSIMDIGVAACIIADGMSSTLKRFRKKREPRINSTWSFLLSARVVLPVLGFIRIFFLWAFNYSHSVMEYGEHWNFFFTMAVIAIVCRLLPRNYPVTIAITFTVFHFFLLAEGREIWILVGENPRSNLLLANIEGISSLTGYLAMYYAAAAIGVFVSNTNDDIKSWLWLTLHFFLISFVFFGAQKGTELFGFLPSRRVCNVTFVLSQLSMLIFSTGVLLFVQMVIWILWASHTPRFSQYDAPYEAVRPDLQDTINRYGLLHFLGCNILTGVVNISIYTSSVDDIGAVGILMVYQAVMAALCQYLRGRGQKKSGVLV